MIEELLEGEELSLLAICDGQSAVPLAPAQDFKRLEDGDRGPNTGGMGSYSPVPGIGPAEVEELLETVHRPVLAELSRRGAPFVGLLYAGLMLTDDGAASARSSTAVSAIRRRSRFCRGSTATCSPRSLRLQPGDLGGGELATGDRAAVTVVLAGADYRSTRGDRGTPIEGVEDAEAAGALVFHAGTAERVGRLLTNGGRILNVIGAGDDVAAARARCVRRRRADLVRRACSTEATSPQPRRLVSADGPLVGILVGSESDRERMQAAIDELDAARGRARVRSAIGAPRSPTPLPSMRARRGSAGCGS